MSGSTEASAITEYFKRKSVFITGATGWDWPMHEIELAIRFWFDHRFVGKQLVEKLVRSCPGQYDETWINRIWIILCFDLDIEHIYLLVRPKRGHGIADRLKELLNSQVCVCVCESKCIDHFSTLLPFASIFILSYSALFVKCIRISRKK